MVLKSKDHRTSPPGGRVGMALQILLRATQILVGLVVAGLYATELHSFGRRHEKADSRWVYAEVVAGLSIITAAIYLVPFARSNKVFAWDAVLFVLWSALFGVFGNLYMHKDCKHNTRCGEMKAGMWFDMIGMLLWFISAAVGGINFWRGLSTPNYTGRAVVV